MNDEEYRTLCRAKLEEESFSLSGVAALEPIFKDPNYGLSDADYSISVQRLWDVKTDGERDRRIVMAKNLEETHQNGAPSAEIETSFFGLLKRRTPNPAFQKWEDNAPLRIAQIQEAWAQTNTPVEIRDLWAAQMRAHLRVYRRETGLDGPASLIEEAYRYAKTSHLWKV